MNPDPIGAWGRWVAAERDGRVEEAEAAFRDLAQVLPTRLPRSDFAGRVMHTVERAAIRQARVARALMLTAGVSSAVLMVGTILQLPRLLQAALDGGVAALLWTFVALDRGLDTWAILAQVGRTVAAVINTPEVTFALVVIGLVAVAALYGLQRMLELEERSSL